MSARPDPAKPNPAKAGSAFPDMQAWLLGTGPGQSRAAPLPCRNRLSAAGDHTSPGAPDGLAHYPLAAGQAGKSDPVPAT